MRTNRRRFLALAAGTGALSFVAKLRSADAGEQEDRLTAEKLDKAAAAPVLNLEAFKSPVIIESIELLRKDREYFVRVRSKDGAEGVSLCNGRAPYLHPILNRLVIPYFIGKDARELESHLFGVYRHRSNYKLQGLAFWCPVAWVEFALLDMLGRISGQS